jgi:TPP-dependent pyruvate/acetoin dehydrogenase alpha subunit
MAEVAKEPEKVSDEGSGLISNSKLRLLYSTMLKCRMLAERNKFAGDSMAGQEATTVGTAIDLTAEDAIGPCLGEVFTGFFKGVPLATIFGRLANSEKGSAAHSGFGPRHVIPADSTIAMQLKFAMGVALTNKTKKNGAVVVSYLPDSASCLEAWDEALHSAAAQDLPMLFVIPNTPQAAGGAIPEPSLNLRAKADGYGMPRIVVDGNDVVAMYRVGSEALSRARRGFGPTLIDCTTYPLKDTDPIAAMEQYLNGKKLFTPEWKQEILDGFRKELDAATR